ncbi:MAG: multidrug efflux SMR transporter [Eggerthellaceae bacterium]|nr:multidrug efflux SMR transporter [Eggerthellaceae bacterium]
MQWIYLFVAGLCETFWAWELKASDGLTHPVHTVLFIVGMCASMIFLGLALKSLPLYIAYTLWTGIGVVGTTIVSLIVGGEQITGLQFFFIGCIIVGIAGLHASTQ